MLVHIPGMCEAQMSEPQYKIVGVLVHIPNMYEAQMSEPQYKIVGVLVHFSGMCEAIANFETNRKILKQTVPFFKIKWQNRKCKCHYFRRERLRY